MKEKFKIYVLVILTLSLFTCSIVDGQTDIAIKKRTFNHGLAGFKDAWKAVKAGDNLFVKNAFNQAITPYEKAYAYNSNNAELNYKLGVCYLFDKKSVKAEQLLEKSYQKNPDITSDVLYFLGQAYQSNSKIDKALTAYSDYVEKHKALKGKGSYEGTYYSTKRKIQECKNAKELMKKPIRVFIDNLGSDINSEYREHSPVITADESMIIFTSRRENTTGNSKKINEQSLFNEDLYVSTKDNEGNWTQAVNMKDLNTEGHDASIGLSYDGQILYSYKGTPNGTILESRLKGDKWSKPKEMPKHINTKYQESSASLSPDGKIFYFVSNRPEDDFGVKSLGGSDIFYCKLKENGKWGKAHNIGTPINTRYDEDACFIHPDGITMYFSSKGHKTMGGYDIFKSVKNSEGKWSKPENIGYPVNTPADDVFFVMAASGKTGYYSTVTPTGYGEHDIYRITFLGNEKLMVEATEDNLMSDLYSPLTDKVDNQEIEEETVRLTLLKGLISDAVSNQPLVADIEIIDNEKNEVVSVIKSNSATGKYMLSLPSGKNYGISVKSEGYLFHSENFNLPKSKGYQEITKNIALSKVDVGEKIVLKNIFFDTNKSSLRPESYPELRTLKKLLEAYPDMKVEIGGHTDNRGTLKYNTTLSESRAKAVVDYLINAGIENSRLEFKGYAYLQPIDTNDTDEGRQQNRRVEFKIISIK